MMNIWGIIISYIYIFLVIIIAKFFEKLGKEASRKFIHIMLGNWWIIAMFFFDNVISAAFVPITFVIINYISYKKDLISVMERTDNKKEGLGTVYYAISLLILAIITFGFLKRPELGLVPVLFMAYGDGLAAVLGQAIKSKKYSIGSSKKSVAGSLTMFIVCVIISAIFLFVTGNPNWIVYSILMSAIITVIEAVSIKGLDNLTVPLFSMLIMALI